MASKKNHKRLLAKITRINPESKVIEGFLDDTEHGGEICRLLNEIEQLSRRITKIKNRIKTVCKFRAEDWGSDIEKIIIAETGTDKKAAQATRKRKNEILEMIDIAIEEGMGPSEIQTIIETMIMGMQPGKTGYLIEGEDDGFLKLTF